MKTIKAYLLFLKDLTIFFFGFIVFFISSRTFLKFKTPNKSYISLIRLFCFTSGKFNDFLSSLISFFDKPIKLESITGVLGDLDAHQINNITNEIKKNGYYIFQKKLPEQAIQSLYNFASQIECSPRPLDNDSSKKILKVRFKEKPDLAAVYDIDPNDSLKHIEVQKLVNDFSILSIAQSYLNTSPKIEPPAFWWSSSHIKIPDSNSAQLFHFDMDRIKWIKFFIFLTDVTVENGPHVFISKSHLSGAIPKKILNKGYSRLSDQEVFSSFPNDNIKKFIVPAGTIVAEDTRGLHKGTNLTKGNRLVLELQFSNCLFGAQNITIFPSTLVDANSAFKNIVTSYPKIYASFTK